MTNRSKAGRKVRTYWVWVCWPAINNPEKYGCKDAEALVQRDFASRLHEVKGKLLEWHRVGKYALEAKIRSEPGHEDYWKTGGFVILGQKP